MDEMETLRDRVKARYSLNQAIKKYIFYLDDQNGLCIWPVFDSDGSLRDTYPKGWLKKMYEDGKIIKARLHGKNHFIINGSIRAVGKYNEIAPRRGIGSICGVVNKYFF